MWNSVVCMSLITSRLMITSLCNSQRKATCAAVLPYFSPIWVRVGLDQVPPDKHHNPIVAFPRHCLTLSSS
ncbi:MAG: hypothetical protein KIG93_01430 [Prevotella sp.]|nr:hypothetical protein [Prevotella sp.]